MPNADNEPQIPKNQSPISDERTGMVSRDWYRFFLNLLNKANEGGGGGGTGTVTSVSVSGGATGMSFSGNPVTTSGTITMAGTLDLNNGGTGATTAAGARTALDVPSTSGSGATGTWSISVSGNAGTVTNGVYTSGSYADPTWITSLGASKLTGTVTTAAGGTGLSSIGTANQLLGVNSGASGLEYKSLVAGTNITITQGAGTVTIDSSNPGGTVTSVGLSLPAQFTVTNSPVTGSGTLTGAWANQTANLVFASPNGSTGVPTFRSLVAADIPALSYVSSVTGTSPVVSSGGLTPAISLASGYGDTQNPYASKTANYFLAAPNGSAGVPTFRAIVAADIPTLNQNTTGTASNVTGTVAIANGGTGQTAKTAAFDALSPTTTKGDLIINNGTNNVRQAVGADGLVLQADSTAATGVKWAATATNTIGISNDTTTATNLYPTFAAATTGSVSTVYTGNAKLLYKPSTGELTSTAVVASNGIFVNSLTVSTSYTIAAGYSGMSAGVVSVANGITVTVSNGSRWVVV